MEHSKALKLINNIYGMAHYYAPCLQRLEAHSLTHEDERTSGLKGKVNMSGIQMQRSWCVIHLSYPIYVESLLAWNSPSVLVVNGCRSLGFWFNGQGLYISVIIFAKLTDTM